MFLGGKRKRALGGLAEHDGCAAQQGVPADVLALRARTRLSLGVRHQEPTMGDSLETLKAGLERFGEANDAATNEPPHRMLKITREGRCTAAAQ